VLSTRDLEIYIDCDLSMRTHVIRNLYLAALLHCVKCVRPVARVNDAPDIDDNHRAFPTGLVLVNCLSAAFSVGVKCSGTADVSSAGASLNEALRPYELQQLAPQFSGDFFIFYRTTTVIIHLHAPGGVLSSALDVSPGIQRPAHQ